MWTVLQSICANAVLAFSHHALEQAPPRLSAMQLRPEQPVLQSAALRHHGQQWLVPVDTARHSAQHHVNQHTHTQNATSRIAPEKTCTCNWLGLPPDSSFHAALLP
eukprot:5104757-Amphidinium_carterae.1